MIFTLCLLILSIWVAIESWRLSLGNLHEIGPGFFLFFVATLMGILSLGSLTKVLMSRARIVPAFSSYKKLIGVIWTFIISIVLTLFFDTLGFVIMAMLFMTALLRLVGKERWLRLSIVTALTTVLSYFLFKVLLKIELPAGFLGI